MKLLASITACAILAMASPAFADPIVVTEPIAGETFSFTVDSDSGEAIAVDSDDAAFVLLTGGHVGFAPGVSLMSATTIVEGILGLL